MVRPRTASWSAPFPEHRAGSLARPQLDPLRVPAGQGRRPDAEQRHQRITTMACRVRKHASWTWPRARTNEGGFRRHARRTGTPVCRTTTRNSSPRPPAQDHGSAAEVVHHPGRPPPYPAAQHHHQVRWHHPGRLRRASAVHLRLRHRARAGQGQRDQRLRRCVARDDGLGRYSGSGRLGQAQHRRRRLRLLSSRSPSRKSPRMIPTRETKKPRP